MFIFFPLPSALLKVPDVRNNDIRTLHNNPKKAYAKRLDIKLINDMQEQHFTPAPKYPARTHRRINRRLEELLGHIRTAAFVDDVRGGEEDLEGYDEEDEEAHARSRCGDGWEQTSAYLRRIRKYDLPPPPGLERTEDR